MIEPISPSTQPSNPLLMKTVDRLRSMLGPEMDLLTIERAVIGIFFSGIKLSNGEGGICFTPVKEIPEAVCCPSSARAMPNSGKLVGQPVGYYIQRMQNGGPLQKALGIAVLNALSATCWRAQPPTEYRLITGADPVENRTIDDDANVVVIGALVPYFKMLKQRKKPFTILEKDSRTLKPDEMQFFQPQEKAAVCIADADLLIITGTTLINNTLEDILGPHERRRRGHTGRPHGQHAAGGIFRARHRLHRRHRGNRRGPAAGYPDRGRLRLPFLRKISPAAGH